MPKPAPFEILHADDHLLVISKAPGILSLPDRFDPDAPHVRTLLQPEFGDLWVVHRLDKEASGVMVLARTAEAHRNLNEHFRERKIQKTYRVLVRGVPLWDEQAVDAPLRTDGDRLHRVVVDRRGGKESLTRFRVLERFRSHALLEARPETGRTHQIRVHAAELSLPVVCDALYGDATPLFLSAFKRHYRPSGSGEERPLLARLGLHALSLRFSHPASGESVAFEAALPKDFRATLNQLRKC